MSTKVIDKVLPSGEPWSNDYGRFIPITVLFNDGSVGSLNCKPENEERTHAALSALVGKEAEFKLEDKGKSQKGNQKWAIKEYPKQGGSSSRPSSSGQGSSSASEFRTPEQIVRGYAASAAAQVYQGTGATKADVLELAEAITEFVNEPAAGSSREQSPSSPQDPAAGTTDDGPPPERSAYGEGVSGSEKEASSVNKGGEDATPEGSDSPPDLLTQVAEKFGSKSKVLIAARKAGHQVNTPEDIPEEVLKELVEA